MMEKFMRSSGIGFPALKSAVESHIPTLMLRRNVDTGKWAYKRTHGQWIGGFAKAEEAIAGERLGLTQPYRVEFVERDE